jgi:hypothetical protein
MKPGLAFLACALAGASWAGAQTAETSLDIQGYYGFPNHAAVDSRLVAPIDYGVLPGASKAERDVGSSWGSAGIKAILARKLTSPALVGPGALTRGNNVGLELSLELSPLSLVADVEATVTPVAFLVLGLGASGGTGWDIGFKGLAALDPDTGEAEGSGFGGLVYRAWGRATLQFDLAALLPGAWNHVVLLASPKLEYRAYAGAGDDEAWIWEADDGMNLNGWKLKGSYFLGYRMPLALDMAGILLETEGYLGTAASRSPMASSGWGSDFVFYTIGLVLDFRLGRSSSLAILPQFKTGIDWSDATTMALRFEDRSYEGPYLYFYRVAFDYSLKI